MSKTNPPKNLEQVCASLLPREIKKLNKKAGNNLMSRSAYIRKLVVEDEKTK